MPEPNSRSGLCKQVCFTSIPVTQKARKHSKRKRKIQTTYRKMFYAELFFEYCDKGEFPAGKKILALMGKKLRMKVLFVFY
jgi:hypothetical protein